MEYDEHNRSDFEKNFDNIKGWIDDCDFFAVDTELTGTSEKNDSYYDNSELRYNFLRDNSMKYTVTQLGICLFKYDFDKKRFKYRTFNFHLKPYFFDPENEGFLIRLQTIDFLNKENFDYNRWLRDGMKYSRYSNFLTYKELLEKKKGKEIDNLEYKLSESEFSSVADIIRDCRAFMRDKQETELSINVPQDKFQKHLILNELWKIIGCINGNEICVVQEKDGSDKDIIMIRKSKNVHSLLVNAISESYANQQKQLSNYVKISELVKYLGESQKLFVLHSGCLDIMHLYDKFIEPVPEEFQTFKKRIHDIFPLIIDTKEIFNDKKFMDFQENKQLQFIFNRTTREPFVNHDELFEPFSKEYDCSNEVSFHNAHYDAMVTGKLFISLSTYLSENNFNSWNKSKFEIPKALDGFLNKISVLKIGKRFFNIDPKRTENDDEKRHFNNLYFMTFPGHWTRQDVHILFMKAFAIPYKRLFEMEMKSLNSRSLWIRWPFDVDIRKVTLEESDVKIYSYNQYYNITDRRGNESANRRKNKPKKK